MARVEKDILRQIEESDDINQYEKAELWASTVEEGLKTDPERRKIYEYVKKRITAISGYSAVFFQEKALEKLIDSLYKKAGSIEAIDDNMIIDLINYISGLNPYPYGYDIENSHLNTHKR